MNTSASTSFDFVAVGILFTVALLVAIIAPGARARWMSICILPIWLSLGQLTGLGTISHVAKASSFAPYLMLIIACIRYPAVIKRPSPSALIHPYMALLAVVFVATTADAFIAMGIRLTWLALTIAALVLAFSVRPTPDTLISEVIRPLLFGTGIAVLISASSLVLDPETAFFRGTGRFFPWGASPNQVGAVYALHVPLALWLTLRTDETAFVRVWAGSTGFIAVAALFIGVPRGLLAITLLTCAPILARFIRRPVALLAAALLMSLSIGFATDLAENAGHSLDLERLMVFDTSRLEIQSDYIRSEIAERPALGLFATHGKFSDRGAEDGRSTHSAYLYLLYLGGALLAIPVALVTIAALISGLVTLGNSEGRRQPFWLLLWVQLLGISLHAAVAVGPFYPTYSWSFWNIFLVTMFLRLGSERSNVRMRVDTAPDVAPRPVGGT